MRLPLSSSASAPETVASIAAFRRSSPLSTLRFHIEHVIARQHGGKDSADNLALACPECNLHKGTNLSSIDPDTGTPSQLFHPRRDRWEEHFVRDGSNILGKTATGRTTAWLLEMNSGERLRLRTMLLQEGLWE